MLNTKRNVFRSFNAIIGHVSVFVAGERVERQSVSDIVCANENCREWISHFMRRHVDEFILLTLGLFCFS